MSMLTKEEKGRFISILADGKFHETVSASTDGAVEREFETSDGKKGTKHELVYTKIEAYIRGVEFKDGDFGQQILIAFEDEEGNKVTLAQNTASNYAEDLMKKLPLVDLNEKVKVTPFSFTDEKQRNVKGVTLFQGKTPEGKEKKVPNYFKEGGTEKPKYINGFPEPQGDTSGYDKDDWKVYFISVRKFLVKHTQDTIIPKLGGSVSSLKPDYPEGSDKDIPF